MANEIKEITKLAKQLADKELSQPATADSKEMLDALEAVAQLLQDKSGTNNQSKSLQRN